MSHIKRKLQSKRGASLLIAMVFMIFAVFVGGSVLAAASANGYRIAHLSDQQDYLNQRSAALLLADEMNIDSVSDVRLEAKFATITRQGIIIMGNSEIVENGEPSVSYTMTFQAKAGGKMDALRRVMFETAVLRYLEENPLEEGIPIYFEDFVYDNGTAEGEKIERIDQFWTSDDGSCAGTIHITGVKDGETFTDYTARYISGAGSALYDFVIDFDEYSQLTITMDGYSNIRFQRGTPEYEAGTMIGGNEHTTRVTTGVARTTISWNAPFIAKGGAAE